MIFPTQTHNDHNKYHNTQKTNTESAVLFRFVFTNVIVDLNTMIGGEQPNPHAISQAFPQSLASR